MDRNKNLIAVDLMRKGYEILRKSNQEHLLKSAHFLREAIEKIKTA